MNSSTKIDVDLSIVIPVYNESQGINALFSRLDRFISKINGLNTEVILVDDCSLDESPDLIQKGCATRENFRYLRLARNRGSHVAILAGLSYCQGKCAVFLAADLQDPPELIEQMIDFWHQGNRIVWAIRERREGISKTGIFFSNIFYMALNFSNQFKVPPKGSDFALLDRQVVKVLLKSVGTNPSIGIDIARLGFRQAQLQYTKEERRFGSSKWNTEKKLKAFADAFVSSSYMPLRVMSYLGIFFSFLGFIGALIIISLALFWRTQPIGWPSLMVITLVLGGIQMNMMGIIGEYLWRTLEESRHRPLFIIEDSMNIEEERMAD